MNPKHSKRSPLHWNLEGTTNFYPLYLDGKGDKVQAIVPTRPTMFQQIIPRYRLSATQTRDDGVGPMFEEVAYRPSIFPQKKDHPHQSHSDSIQTTPKYKHHKIRTDFWM